MRGTWMPCNKRSKYARRAGEVAAASQVCDEEGNPGGAQKLGINFRSLLNGEWYTKVLRLLKS